VLEKLRALEIPEKSVLEILKERILKTLG